MNAARKILSIAFLFLAFSGGAILLFVAVTRTPAEPQHATVLPAPMSLPEFSLLDHRGEAFTRDRFKGDWNLVFFGFTNCPDICPATLQQLAIAKERVEESGDDFPGIILVSVDPDRDSPGTMADYVGHFGDDMTGVTGNISELLALTKPLGIYFAKSGDAADNYSVDHSAVVLLINKNAEWSALFSAPHAVSHFVEDVPLLTDN